MSNLKVNLDFLIKPALALSLIFVSSNLYAQNAQTNSSQAANSSYQKIANQESLLSRIKFELGMEYSQNVSVDELSRRESGVDIGLSLSYKLTDFSSLLAKTAFSRSNNPPNNTEVTDTLVGMSLKGYDFSKTVNSAHALLVILPTSEKSKKENRLYSGLVISNGINYNGDILKAGYSISLGRSFHEFNINANNVPNIEYNVSNKISLNIGLSEKFSINNEFIYKTAWTYASKQRFSYEYHSDLMFEASDKWALNLGTSNAGNALKANGLDSNINVFDENTSIVRAGLSLSL